ncbi:MAG TPA: sigma 54-interacting transcriptional regulator [Bryobacteraceae bacterium]|nr:sigma 54-interacting transcriptional regulator [Bryobacteraceae bacterium]
MPADLRSAERHALVLRVWEAVNVERDLAGVLAAVADVITPVVPFSAIGIVSFEGEKHDLYAMHIVGASPQPEAARVMQEMAGLAQRPLEWKGHKLIPYTPQPWKQGDVNAVDDLMAREDWYEHDFFLAHGGVRSYAAAPLFSTGNLIGTAVFSRGQAAPFNAEQKAVLADISRALAVAVANALANEEIRKLRDQLEAENIALRAQLGQAPWFEDIIGDSPALRAVLEAVEQVAPTDASVLITGETGTGKELIARAIHRRSPRARGPLVQVNCSAIPATLLAAELFGHERGAFTGAVERRKGRFEQAHGGTLFLDEIGELPAEMQVMLLRVLQQREFERLGSGQTVRVDVRIVAATNRDLAAEVQAGRFRSDLFYRLNVFPIRVPPLRERPADIPLLVEHFAARHGARIGRPIARIDRRSMAQLEAYAWPGNVRELENVVERAVILSRNGTLRIERDLLPGAGAGGDVTAHLEAEERQAIEVALRATHGRISGANGAARRLGLPASTLEFRIRRLGIDKFRFRKAHNL